MKTALTELIRCPEGMLGEPSELVERGDLTNKEKIAVLRSWQTDLIELQTAADENMDGAADSATDGTATRLAQVMSALAVLQERQA